MLKKFLPRNEHSIERVIRVALGVAGIAAVFVGPQTPWGWLGLIPLVTGLAGTCPIYAVLGIGTCKVPQRG